jgi:adenine-specific DNA-methyltransferase
MSETLNDHLPLSPDHNAERLAALKKLFPDLFSNDGRLNVDELKKVVDPALVSETERYDFRWYGKTKSKREAFTPSRAALVYDPARSVNPEKAGGNMIIEGENLEVLKLLTSAYRERIKCIYIDGPYNTGKDFVYSDNFAEGQKPYWEQTGVTEGGVKVDTNTDSDGRFHSNWLSMMHSRLLVARYLLKPDGAIFVSIDDGEVQNLRRVLNEVFGEENFVATFIWEKRTTRENRRVFSFNHDYVVCFAREKLLFEASRNLLPLTEDIESRYSNPDNDSRGDWQSVSLNAQAGHATKEQFYSITTPSGRVVEPPPGRCWLVTKPRYDELVADNRVWFGADGNNVPREKIFRSEAREGITPHTIWTADEVGTTDSATKELMDVFGGDCLFDAPKSVGLIKRTVQISTKPDDLILDFFGGSGTSAQAVIEMNKADGGNRQFILVQLPEFTPEDSPAFKAGFKRISDITIKRATLVVQKLKTEAEGFLPNDPQRQFADSLGFKVYTLAKSAFPRVEFAPDPAKTEAENIELLKQYIREKEATFHLQFEKDKVLDEVLLKNGFMLDYTLTRQPDFKKNEVFLAKDAHKESLVCLDAKVEPETVDYFKTHKDQLFICLELALDTTRKWNLKHNLGEKLKAI